MSAAAALTYAAQFTGHADPHTDADAGLCGDDALTLTAAGEQAATTAGFAAEEVTRDALLAAVGPAVASYLVASEALVLGSTGMPNLALIADSAQFVKDAVNRIGEGLRDAWRKLYTRTGEDLLPAIRAYLEGLKIRLGGLHKAVYKRGLTALDEARMAHAQIDAVREAIRAILEPSQWQAYTNRVAATEAVIAVNQARHEAAMSAYFGGAQIEKTWQTRKDARVRHNHKQAQGQTVPFAAPFIVDGWPMLYPGDPSAPPSLFINCRCGVTYKVVSRR